MRLEAYKHIYLIGIGGIGMSALARYFNTKGKIVCGYDNVKSDLCIELENEGISIHYTNSISEITEKIKSASPHEILVIYTAAISPDHQVLLFFRDRGITILKRAEALGIISRDSFTIAVAGTHGKTTTSTMLAHILQKAGKETTAFLGGISRNYKTNLLLSDKSDILIVEADEYDRSFLQIHADVAIITSVGADHLDIYEDENNIRLAFKQFASQVKKKGILLVEESISMHFSSPQLGKILTYSAKNSADYYAQNVSVHDGRMRFDMIFSDVMSPIDSEKRGEDIMLLMPGLHNVSNAIAASAVASYLGLSVSDILHGLSTFEGVNRRFEKHIDTKKKVYIDDYAHHPEEVSATIFAAKQLYPLRELIVVFQPHLFSRTKDFADEFADSLKEADDLVLLDIYAARENPIDGVSSEMLLALCSNSKKEVCAKEELLSVLEKKNIDVLLTLGAGDIGTLVQPIKHMLN